jgi:hypothetical protein
MRPLLLVLALAATGCAALRDAAPTLLDASERILRTALDEAAEDARREELRQALALVAEARRAEARAEEAATRAEQAAKDAQDTAALAVAALEAAEAREQSAALQRRIALALRDAVRRPAR